MNHRRIVGTSLLGVIVVAATACDRPKPERQQPTSETTPERRTEPRGTEGPVGTAETHGATTGAPAPATATTGTSAATTPGAAPSLPTNLPPFEGELKVRMQGKAPESIDYAMKGDKIRLGVSSAPGQEGKGIDAIVDTTDKKATILLNDRKEFVDVDLAKLAQKAKTRLEDVDLERTGRTETISGRQCEEWKIKDREYQVTACVAKGAPYFDLDALERSANFKAPGWVHRVVDEGYIPLRVNVTDASGKSVVSSQVADTSRQVDSSKFEVPVGYRKADPSKLPGVPKP